MSFLGVVGPTTIPHQRGNVLSVNVSFEKRYLRVLETQALEIREQATRVRLSAEQRSMISSMSSWGASLRPSGAMCVSPLRCFCAETDGGAGWCVVALGDIPLPRQTVAVGEENLIEDLLACSYKRLTYLTAGRANTNTAERIESKTAIDSITCVDNPTTGSTLTIVDVGQIHNHPTSSHSSAWLQGQSCPNLHIGYPPRWQGLLFVYKRHRLLWRFWVFGDREVQANG